MRELAERLAATGRRVLSWDLIPGAWLLEPPWGDRERTGRGEERDARAESLFARWPLLVPQLFDFGHEIP